MKKNLDANVVADFGKEWSCFDQSGLTNDDQKEIFDSYFSIFPWKCLPMDSVGFDLGCGSGRWAELVVSKVGLLHCIDASKDALNVAKKKLSQKENCIFHEASVDNIPLEDETCDFGYSLGVLHHIPDTMEGIKSCVKKLKKGAPFLVYLYYSFDNRPRWFKFIWKLTNLGRILISRMPFIVKYILSQIIAVTVYYPIAMASKVLERGGLNVDVVPLSSYRNRSFYVMQTDALDRFGTKLEQRFSKEEIRSMMEEAGLKEIVFSEKEPYWCAVGFKR